MDALFQKFLLFSLLVQYTSGKEPSWNGGADIIRIQNNGSEIRTIFLPKINTSLVSSNVSNRHNIILHFDNPTQAPVKRKGLENYKNHTSNHKQSDESNIKLVASKYQKLPQRLKGNFSESYLKLNLVKMRKKDPSINRTLSGINVNTEKIGKLLNIFTIVNFTNGLCYTTEGLVGTCYHALECQRLAGLPQGLCAHGYGVCCYVERTCGERSSMNNSYVSLSVSGVNRDPRSGVFVCSVTINPATADTHQLRLSFATFELAPPIKGNCAVDSFVITGQNRNDVIPPICGFNTGQHVYVDIDTAAGPVTLTLLSAAAGNSSRRVRVLVTHLRSQDPLVAPHNCLQYLTEPRGSVESFNYRLYTANAKTTLITPGYFNNLNYAVCFKKLPGFCGIVYSNKGADGKEFIFELVNVEKDGVSTVPEGQAGAEVFDCPSDYILLGGVRLCGYRLNDGSTQLDYSVNHPITDDTSGPLVLYFRTNGNTTGRGFHLEYRLTPCMTRA